MREIRAYCPTCGGELEQISEHLEKTKTQPEFDAQYWCLVCQEYLYEDEIDRDE